MTTSYRIHPVGPRGARRLLPGLGLLLVFAGAGSACGHAASAGASSPVSAADVPARAPLLVNVTHGKSDLQAASMGFGLAKTALERGHKVVVFLNVEAAGLAAADLPADVHYADFPPVRDMLRGRQPTRARPIDTGGRARSLPCVVSTACWRARVEHTGVFVAL